MSSPPPKKKKNRRFLFIAAVKTQATGVTIRTMSTCQAPRKGWRARIWPPASTGITTYLVDVTFDSCRNPGDLNLSQKDEWLLLQEAIQVDPKDQMNRFSWRLASHYGFSHHLETVANLSAYVKNPTFWCPPQRTPRSIPWLYPK